MERRRLSPEEAYSVYAANHWAKGNRESILRMLNAWREEGETPEYLANIVEEFFTDVKGYSAIAEEKEKRYRDSKKAEEDAKKKKDEEDFEAYVKRSLPSKERLQILTQEIPLNEQEILDVADALLRGTTRFDAIKRFNSAQLHLFMRSFNWDSDEEIVDWIARAPNCDAGTALFIAWRIGLVREAFEAQVTGKWDFHGYESERDLVLYIHDRWVKKQYKTEFFYDPRNDDGDWTGEDSPENSPGADPSFFGPTPGKAYNWPHLASS